MKFEIVYGLEAEDLDEASHIAYFLTEVCGAPLEVKWIEETPEDINLAIQRSYKLGAPVHFLAEYYGLTEREITAIGETKHFT